MKKYLWPALYILGIVLINWAFIHIPMIRLPWGDFWSVGTLGIGFIYLVRDVCQRQYGHKVLALMVVGIIVTYLMSPKLALASGLAFGLGEGLEWVIFTTTKKTFRQRVLWSAIPSVVVDTAVFLVVAGFFTWANFGFETITKMLALAWISFIPDPLGETK